MAPATSPNYLFIVLLALLTACGPGPESTDTTSSDNNTEPLAPDEMTFDAGKYINQLQGTWKRTTYPYGTVQFQGRQVKYDEGEGMVEAPSFEPYEIADNCPYTNERESVSTGEAYLAIGDDKSCTKLTLEGDQLAWGLPNGDAINYRRVSEAGTDAGAENLARIPEALRGSWAKQTQHCDSRNDNRIDIGDQQIRYFEAEAVLMTLQESSPTRIQGNFTYERAHPEATPQDWKLSLDAQDDGQTLIIQELHADAQPGPLRYVRCNN